MKLLSIGNSFSTDAHRWLHQLAGQNGWDLLTANLFISGCSLQRHWDTVSNGKAEHAVEINGNRGLRFMGIVAALRSEKWDVVTVQQASRHSGFYETYEPYLTNLLTIIKKECPTAKIYFHQTWAYEHDETFASFEAYDNSQAKMFARIREATAQVEQKHGLPLIRVGEAIQKIRETVKEFDYQNGGISLCRDGHHLSYNYGRFAAAAMWLHVLFGQKVTAPTFEEFDSALLAKILSVINRM